MIIDPSALISHSSLTVAPAAVIAGEATTITITLTIGECGVDQGGRILILQPVMSDWAEPNFTDPQSANYCSVEIKTAGRSSGSRPKLTPSFGFKFFPRPLKWALCLDVGQDSLHQNDQITVTLRGSAQTFSEKHHQIHLAIDPTSSCFPKLLGVLGEFEVRAGPPVRAVAVIPSCASANTPVVVRARLEDRWGNAIIADSLKVSALYGPHQERVDLLSLEPLFHFPQNADYVSAEVEVRFGSQLFTCRTNPCQRDNDLGKRIYWADLHGQSDSTIGAGSDQDYFSFARDIGFLDVVGHQGNDFQLSDEKWADLQRFKRQFNQDGKFVTIPGYEWSGNTTAGGDRNIFFNQEDLPIIRSSNWLIPSDTKYSVAATAEKLFESLRAEQFLGKVLHAAHIGGRHADLSKGFAQDIPGLIEVASAWGIFEWHLFEAMERDLIFGVVANSDGHHGKPGAEYPSPLFGVPGGLTAIVAPELSRKAIFSALCARRCYATTGARILLATEYTSREGSGVMGEVLTGAEPGDFTVSVIGTNTLRGIDIFQGTTLITSIANEQLGITVPEPSVRQYRLTIQGAYSRGRDRQFAASGVIYTDALCTLKIVSASGFFDPDSQPQVTAAGHIEFNVKLSGQEACIDFTLLSNCREATPPSVIVDSNVGRSELSPPGSNDPNNRLKAEVALATPLGPRGVVQTLEAVAAFTGGTYSYRATVPIVSFAETKNKLTPLWCRVRQDDGHIAWSTPIFLRTGAYELSHTLNVTK